jgi:hypothetical protein
MENDLEERDSGSLKVLFQHSPGRTKDNQWQYQANPTEIQNGYLRNTS